ASRQSAAGTSTSVGQCTVWPPNVDVLGPEVPEHVTVSPRGNGSPRCGGQLLSQPRVWNALAPKLVWGDTAFARGHRQHGASNDACLQGVRSGSWCSRHWSGCGGEARAVGQLHNLWAEGGSQLARRRVGEPLDCRTLETEGDGGFPGDHVTGGYRG